MVVQLLAQASEPAGGSSLVGLALPVLMIVGFYFLLIRPQRNRQKAQQALLSTLEVGDEVMTTGGIFGTIVEIAPGTRVRMLRAGVAQRFVEDDDVGDEDDVMDEGADRQP